MQAQIAKLGERLRSNLWFVPATMTLAASLLAFVLVELDRRLGAAEGGLPWAFIGGANSARAVLSTIAGSMITVAGTTYSITIVALTLASSQFAPRVLRSFMRNRTNQVVLGFFVAAFTYCLLVLQAISDAGTAPFVPGIAVTGGVALALISLGMLIYFIDHISHSIRVSSIIAGIAEETEEQLNRLYPPWGTAPDGDPDAPVQFPDAGAPIVAAATGYVQFIDYAALLALLTEAGMILRVEREAGDFVIAGAPLGHGYPAAAVTPARQDRINRLFALGKDRTLQQDIVYGVRQIEDIALKALSPATNDPTTGLNCIDYLGVVLAAAMRRAFASLNHVDAAGQTRILTRTLTFHELLDVAFDQIRYYGAKEPAILARLLDILGQLASMTADPSRRQALREHVERIAAVVEPSIADPYAQQRITAQVEAAREALRDVDQAPPLPLRQPVRS